MRQEIECKFLNVSHDDIRSKLRALGAELVTPMRLMHRTMFDYPDRRFQEKTPKQRLRIRDEDDKVTITYKRSNGNYPYEAETTIGSYEEMEKILIAVGLENYSYQESKRETWYYNETEIELDEWPWIKPYIEIEGKSEESIKETAKKLGFDWADAKFGSVDTVYMDQFPGMTVDESVGDLPEVRFDMPIPDYFKKRQKKGKM